VFFRESNATELAEIRAFRAEEQAFLASEFDYIITLPALGYHLRFELSTALAEAELYRVSTG